MRQALEEGVPAAFLIPEQTQQEFLRNKFNMQSCGRFL